MALVRVCICVCWERSSHLNAHALLYLHPLSSTCRRCPLHTHARLYTYTLFSTYTALQTHALLYIHTLSSTRTRSYLHWRAFLYTHALLYTHTHSLLYTHPPIYSHTHCSTYPHTPSLHPLYHAQHYIQQLLFYHTCTHVFSSEIICNYQVETHNMKLIRDWKGSGNINNFHLLLLTKDILMMP